MASLNSLNSGEMPPAGLSLAECRQDEEVQMVFADPGGGPPPPAQTTPHPKPSLCLGPHLPLHLADIQHAKLGTSDENLLAGQLRAAITMQLRNFKFCVFRVPRTRVP